MRVAFVRSGILSSPSMTTTSTLAESAIGTKPTWARSKFAVQQPLLTHCDVLSFGSSTGGAAAPRLHIQDNSGPKDLSAALWQAEPERPPATAPSPAGSHDRW